MSFVILPHGFPVKEGPVIIGIIKPISYLILSISYLSSGVILTVKLCKLLISPVVATTAQDQVDQVDVVDGTEVRAAGLVLPAVRIEVHVAERAEPRGRHGDASLSRKWVFIHRNTVHSGHTG